MLLTILNNKNKKKKRIFNIYIFLPDIVGTTRAPIIQPIPNTEPNNALANLFSSYLNSK